MIVFEAKKRDRLDRIRLISISIRIEPFVRKEMDELQELFSSYLEPIKSKKKKIRFDFIDWIHFFYRRSLFVDQ